MMVLFSVYVLLIYVTVNFSVSSDNDIHHTLFGKLGTIQDLFINGTQNEDTKTRRKDDDEDEDDEDFNMNIIELPDIFKFKRHRSMNYTFDVHDYNLINDKYKNFTKQFQNNTRRFIHYEADKDFPNDVIEQHKKGRMASILIQFLMHSKYEVGKALTQREVIRHDKRYMLGYLFNRLRRLKTELFKMVGVTYNQHKITKKFFTIQNLMRSYERVVHFDVDIRDTCELIKKVYAVPKIYDTYSKKKSGKT